MTQFARKKMQMLFPGVKERAELAFVKGKISGNEPDLDPTKGLNTGKLVEFCMRCDFYGVKVIGFDMYGICGEYYDSYSFEKYVPVYDWEWIWTPLAEIDTTSNEIRLFPLVDVDVSKLGDYLST